MTGPRIDVALVTGSNRGLGRALVERLLARGATKIYAGVREPALLDRPSTDPRVVPLLVDLEDRASIRAAAAAAPDTTLLVNNAAYAAFSPPLAANRETIAREMRVNYLGTYDVIAAFAPALSDNRGAVLTVLSKLALTAAPGAAGYAASKAAAHHLHESLRPVLARAGVGTYVAYPGGIDTRMLAEYAGPKTPPSVVAENILDAAQRGETHIFPDAESRAFARERGAPALL